MKEFVYKLLYKNIVKVKNKKILLVGHTMDRGGASHVLSILANRLSEKGWEVELVFLRVRNAYEISNKVNLIALCKPDENVGFRKAFSKLKKLYRESDAGVVISFLLPINFITILATRGLRKKVIISERNDPKQANVWWQFFLSKILYPIADYCVFQTERVQGYYSKKCREKSSIIINPLDTTSFPRKEKYNQKSFVAVGKLWPQKNHLLLIDAFYDFAQKHNGYNLKIFGEGPLRKDIEVRINKLNLVDKVFLMGNQPDVIDKIVNEGIFVLSSDYEGLSNALMEAMCIGMPCISTKCAGADEIIVDGVNGILVDVGDKTQLVKAMEFMAVSSNDSSRIGFEAIKFRNKCSSDAVADEWLNVIEKVYK